MNLYRKWGFFIKIDGDRYRKSWFPIKILGAMDIANRF